MNQILLIICVLVVMSNLVALFFMINTALGMQYGWDCVSAFIHHPEILLSTDIPFE